MRCCGAAALLTAGGTSLDRLARADGVRGVVRARALRAASLATGHVPPESLMRYWLVTSDLPDPEAQVAGPRPLGP